MAHHMVAQFSMSETLGLAAYEQPSPTFLDVPTTEAREYSEETARTIDEEVERLLAAVHIRVRDTLTARRSVLESLGKMLIQRPPARRVEWLAVRPVSGGPGSRPGPTARAAGPITY